MSPKHFDNYVIIQSILLVMILLTTPFTRVSTEGVGLFVGILLLVVGTVLMVMAYQKMGNSFTPVVTPAPEGQLVTTGIYGMIRHPMYTGVVAFALGWSLAWGSMFAILLSIALAVFFAVKAHKEEELLLQKYPEYLEYQKQVRTRMFPFIY